MNERTFWIARGAWQGDLIGGGTQAMVAGCWCGTLLQEATILALGCSERAEEHVLRHTNYWHVRRCKLMHGLGCSCVYV